MVKPFTTRIYHPTSVKIMHSDSIMDQLETDFGTAILTTITGQLLTRNGEPVRLFDQTKHSSEQYYRADEKGKPYVMNWQERKRYYPVTAYCLAYKVDYSTALANLCQQYGLDNGFDGGNGRPPIWPLPLTTIKTPAVIDFIPAEVYNPCRTHFERNGLFVYLCQFFNLDTANALFERYRLGTSKHWRFAGSLTTCLPQFDRAGKLRQVKLIAFHPQTGRRAKRYDQADRWNKRTARYEPDANEKVWFVGKALIGRKDANLQQCYFGEHLLTEQPGKPVAIVEGESTALVMSAIWPEYIWLATGGSTGGKWDALDRFSVLQGRKVVLWPDSGKYDDWRAKAEMLQGIAAGLTVSRYVEDAAPEPNLDLRDLLTWPRWNLNGQTVYGDVLEIEPCSGYPNEWDDPPAPNASPLLRVQPATNWLAKSFPQLHQH